VLTLKRKIMMKSDDLKSFRPFPPPFLMNALEFFSDIGLSAIQKKDIVRLNLEYLRNCAKEETKLIEGIISVLENMESKA
jgi:hypothetical protein